MKNASTSKSNNIESPKTPGGISKSLLTPCRRLGLSRNWRKAGPSPFISPLAASSEIKQEKVESKKRKVRDLENEDSKSPESAVADVNDNATIIDLNNKNTPCRNIDVPRRKKSKSLISAINNTQATVDPESPINSVSIHKNASEENNKNICEVIVPENIKVSTPSQTKSKSAINIVFPKYDKEKQNSKGVEQNSHEETKVIISDNNHTCEINENNRIETRNKEWKPNDLKKECMVVIQKKIFKTGIIDNQLHGNFSNSDNIKIKNNEIMTQTLFDSDSDDVPLKNLTPKTQELSQNGKDDCDIRLYTKKSEDENSLRSKDVSKKLKNPKVISKVKLIDKKTADLYDDDDDDDFADTKKTILIRKTYAKVTKPSKYKSTGSITQRDIDELKGRIEVKKKLLLARAMTEDTKELRDLIKKWQKACQDALIHVMDFMKNKFPDTSNMDYSEILQTFKIPALVVGYDADEDCFNTPDDASIVLSNFNDIYST